MSDAKRVCPACGAEVPPTAGDAEKCPQCGANLAPPPVPGEIEPEAGPVRLRLALVCNGLKRATVAPYAAARIWGAGYAPWVRTMVCVLPFCIGGLTSFCLWILLPPESAYRWAMGVLSATVIMGVPTAVAFFPGGTGAGARRALERLRARAQEIRDEIARGIEWRARQRTLAARRGEGAAAPAEAEEPVEAEAPAPADLEAVEAGVPRAPGLRLVRFLAVAFQVIGWGQFALACAFSIIGITVGAWGLLTVPLVLGLILGGLVMLALGALLGVVADMREELRRMASELGQMREGATPPVDEGASDTG